MIVFCEILKNRRYPIYQDFILFARNEKYFLIDIQNTYIF